MNETGSTTTPLETIHQYIEATRIGDVNKIRSLFSPAALMSGFYEGEFYIGSPEYFFDEVKDNPSPSSTGAEYIGDITSSEIIGNIASVTLKEKGYMGLDFTNLFQLACIDGAWLIVSKAYVDE
ncbi:MAG: nuclear transport factor 2 family protein [Gammaproteobacteria bacterium]